MIYETDVVFSAGYRSDISLEEMQYYDPARLEVAEIRSNNPRFSWMIYSTKNETYQVSYRILVATSLNKLEEGKADMWDSKVVKDSSSLAVYYNGATLKPSTIYYWKVKIVDNFSRKYDYSEPKAFITSSELDDYTSMLPLEKNDEAPVEIKRKGQSVLADFGRDAFSQVKLRLNSFTGVDDSVTVHLGECAWNDQVDRYPGYSLRYTYYGFSLKKGYNRYKIKFVPDSRNTDPNQNEMGVSPVLMPEKTGEVYPFRYCELEGYNGVVAYNNIVRTVVNYPFDENLSYFKSSDTILNQIYDLCKWTMRATSFCGMFVDGDRERIPYEADVLINQLSYFAVNNQYSISRNSVERLIYNPTWPTEWILQTLIIAYNDYLYSGDNSLLNKYYTDLKSKTLNMLRNEDDYFIHTGDTINDVDIFKQVHFKGKCIRDIVDWPRGFDDDEYEFTSCNTVVNEYYYYALKMMSKIADAVSNKYDSKYYNKLALQTKNAINQYLVDDNGLYKDGLQSDHNSLHANMFAMAFGIVEEKNFVKVADFVAEKGMICSVYGSQFLLDAVYNSGDDFYGLQLLTDTTMRSWYNMIRLGSTMTTESWDLSLKDNQDWSHPWGAAALNIISRKLMGIEPIVPGFRRVSIRPQLASLENASIKVPTPLGCITMSVENIRGKSFNMTIEIPPNMTAEVFLPGKNVPKIVGSGRWHFSN